MTNQFIFDKGKVIENFNYILQDDPYNDYVGNLVEYDKKIYEIITDISGKVVDADLIPTALSNDVSEIYDYIDYINDRPLNVVNKPTQTNSFEGDVVVEDGRIYYNGIEIIPQIEESYINVMNNNPKEKKSNDNMPTINYVDNRFF